MKNTLTTLILSILTPFAYTQNDSIRKEIATHVEVAAEYPGGLKAMNQFLAKNIRYPKRAIVKNIEGKLTVRFVVDTKGKISGAKILKGMPDCPACEKEALRIIKKMPRWKPAMENGVKVKSYFDLPFVFKLE